MNCARTNEPDQPYFVEYKDADHYICRPEEYELRIIEWLKREREKCEHP